mgnify:CR=1 FL=1
MSRIFLALVSLAAIGVLAILFVRESNKPQDVDKAIARAERIIGLANKQTDRTVAAARQLADRPQITAPPTPYSTVHVTVDPITVVVQQPPPPSFRSREDQFKDWLREKDIW